MPKILYVHAFGGPPLDYALPKIALHGDVHVVLLSRPSPYNAEVLRRHSVEIIDGCHLSAEEVSRFLVSHGRRLSAQAILTLSEFALWPTSDAAIELGLRGPGASVRLARDKHAMRQRWAEAGIGGPAFRSVRSLQDLQEAEHLLGRPFILKDTLGAGGIGAHIIDASHDLRKVYDRVLGILATAREKGLSERGSSQAISLIAEGLIDASPEDWFAESPLHGDFVSVEGLVIDGVPKSLVVTGRLRPLPPFCETADLIPSGLSCSAKRLFFGTRRGRLRR